MAFFTYKALTSDGQEISGRVSAADKDTAIRDLRARQVHVHSIKSIHSSASRSQKKSPPNDEDYFRIIEQLAVLSAAGVNILEALETLKVNATKVKLQEELSHVTRDLRQGQSLSAAMRSNMKSLPAYIPSLLRMAEATGKFPEVAKLISVQMSKALRLRRDIRSALNYPAFLMAVGIFAVGFIFYFVVPRFAGMVRGNEDQLPAFSRFVFFIGQSFQEHFLIIAICTGTALLAINFSTKLPVVAAALQRLRFSLPVIGKFSTLQEQGTWLRVLGLATGSGARLLEALQLAGEAATVPSRRHIFQEVEGAVRSGMGLSEAVQMNVALDPMAVNLLITGERSGNLPDMLMTASEIYDEKIEVSTKRFTELAEPVAILTLSIIVGGVVISLVTAMTSIYDVAL